MKSRKIWRLDFISDKTEGGDCRGKGMVEKFIEIGEY
jgi:hypothetical protein